MEAIEKSEQIIAELFDAQLESVLWFKPIWSYTESKEVADFEARYCNKSASKFLQLPKELVIGMRLLAGELVDETTAHLVFEQCLRVYNAGEPQEFTYYNKKLNSYYQVLRSKVKDGVLSVGKDITEQYLTDKELKRQANKYNTILDASAEGVLLMDAIRDSNGTIIDFKISHCNLVGSRLGKIPADARNKTLLQIFPHLKNSEQFNLHIKVVETGVPEKFETTFRNESGEHFGWFIVSLLKLEDSVLSRFVDISEKKENELKIEKQANLVNSILNASFNGVFALEAERDENGKIVDFSFLKASQKLQELLGRSEEEIIGKKYLAILPPSKHNGLFEMKCKVIETGEPIQKEVFYEGLGINKWFNISMARLGTNGVVETFNDITETRQGKERLRTIINTSQVGLFTLIPIWQNDEITDFRFGIVNQAVAGYIGSTAEILAGSLGSTYFPAYKTNGLFNIYKDTYLTGTSQQFDFHYQDGYDVYFNIKTVKMGNEVLVSFSDQTALKKLQAELEPSVDDLKRSNLSLKEFAYAASHDLQEPLRKINFFADRLEQRMGNKLDEEEKRMFQRMITATARMRTLIDDLLTYSQVSVKRKDVRVIDLNDLVQKVISDLEATITEKNATVTVGLLPLIKGDVVQLRQMFQNLIGNALKYSKASEAPVITVNSVSVSKYVEGSLQPFQQIEICDNGIGFEQKHADKIFQIFQRLHGQAEYQGTGVGLAIVQKVVEQHKGFITAESEPGKGATFKILLPAN